MQRNGGNLMKLFGTKDPLSKLLDNIEQGKDLGYKKIILNAILDLMGYMLLLSILVIITPMLLPVIILVLLQKPVLLLSTALENLTPSLSGKGKTKKSNKFIDNHTRIL